MSEAQKRTPRPSPERRDAKSFPLSPTDGFVLSRVDGTLNEADLTASTGLPEAQVQTSLAKLESLGLIVFDGAPSVSVSTRPASSTATSVGLRTSAVQIRAAVPAPGSIPDPDASRHSAFRAASPASPAARPAETPPAPATALPPAPPSTPISLTDGEKANLVEDVDLEPELRRRVIETHRDLDRRDYYALLGIKESADRKAIKRAYYELAAAFHPDRYFRKRLGSFKLRMEAVFAKLTLAHDTLSDKAKRNEYDAYLSEQRTALAIEEHLAAGLTQARHAEERVERAVSAEINVTAPVPAAPAAPMAPVPATTVAPQVDVNARRDALARRLLGGSPQRTTTSSSGMRAAGASTPPTPQGSTTPSAAGPTSTTDAIDALKRRYQERVAGAKATESRKFAGQAEAALAAGDLVASANAFRIATNLTPQDAELARKAEAAKVKADKLLSDTYTKQAHYEETHDQWTEAARSWARVCKVSPNDANAHERAAAAVLKANGDLHDGARFALHACELDPKNPFYRITLANCYAAAGLVLNARRELDTAARLAPHDDNIQAMIKRVGQPA